ncbi:fungal specific transcription factor domain-containing protein [Aspergillus brunneoviolaceus CBS 621.78]|uniref:Uncharacterized protein n=1 Tax=Aspergillus brunneoviolaceus CBS 621.78 TaxID=1450534 RepID=A0ACD1G5Q1_9EURO|nr:hypothetical protein BO95DRAFT_464813 [Aspergillus brunneoviolaceus CBS 621.78]RAH44571.1 hypothetical protein BO95DRAFT_464813 [Aspergillus brunneoviolaceus CBS 621.78]
MLQEEGEHFRGATDDPLCLACSMTAGQWQLNGWYIKCDAALPRFAGQQLANKASPSVVQGLQVENETSSPNPQETRDSSLLRNDRSLGNPPVGLHFAGRRQPPLTLIWGVPTFSPEAKHWVQCTTGQTMAFAKVYDEGAPGERLVCLDAEIIRIRSQTTDICSLPRQALIESVLQAYQSSRLRSRYPVVEPTLFRTTIASAYNQDRLTLDTRNASSRACVCACLALIPLILEDYHTLSPAECDAFATKAKCLMGEALNGSPSLECLQAAVMLSLHGMLTRSLQTAIYFNIIAARLVFMLGGHITDHEIGASSPDSDQRAASHARNLFWLCYLTDKDLALRCGQPPAIEDSQCDLTLPPNYTQNVYPTVGLSTHDLPDTIIFPFDIRLAMIKSKIFANIYSASSLRKSQYAIEQSIREIEQNLGNWRNSIPPSWQPPPVGLMTEHAVTLRPPRNILLTWFEYYQCACMLHLVRGHYGTSVGIHHVKGGSLLLSNLAVSVEASRRILHHLEFAVSFQSSDASWIATFSVPLASIVVFWSILQDPSNASAPDDVQLLLSASGYLATCHRTLGLPAPILQHFTSMSHYIREFYRLGFAATSSSVLVSNTQLRAH